MGPGSCTVYFTNTDTGYAVGFCGNSVLKTTDGGVTWTNQISVSSGSLHSVHFPDPNVGFTVGWDGEIIRTLNSGTTWDFLTSGTSNQLNSVFFINADTGYVVGNNGIILKTENGGGFPVGIDSHNPIADFLNIYPNPTNGIFTLETSLSGHLTLMDLKGLIIREEDVIGGKSSIDIRPLTSGVYILKFSYEGTTAIRKVVKW